MGASPLVCWRARNGQPAPLPVGPLKEGFTRGAILIEWTNSSRAEYSHHSYAEWTNGNAEFSLLTEDCADGEAFGFWLSSFTCLTAIHRLYELARLNGMAIVWDATIVTDADFVKHYVDDRHEESSIEVASSFEELVEIMSIRWVNCPPEAMHVV